MPTSKAGWVQVRLIIKQWVVFTVEVRVWSSLITSDWAHGGIWVQRGLAGAQPWAHHHIVHLHFRPGHGTKRSSITLLRCQKWRRLPHWLPAWGALHIYKRQKERRSEEWITYSKKSGQLTDFTEKHYLKKIFLVSFLYKMLSGLYPNFQLSRFGKALPTVGSDSCT